MAKIIIQVSDGVVTDYVSDIDDLEVLIIDTDNGDAIMIPDEFAELADEII
jgi:hypothetical protein